MDHAHGRPDDSDLQRFVDAQLAVYPSVIDELRVGAKRSHWMWFVFPQIVGLGASEMSRRYALHSLAEADAYLAHPVLGRRLIECTELVLAARPKPLVEILGRPDDLKFRSCMSLFSLTDRGDALFDEALRAFGDGTPDPDTVSIVRTRLPHA